MKKNKKFFYIILFLLLFLFIFIVANKAVLYAQLGKFYLKRGSDIKAQEYFEKAYNLENKDISFRKIYVNSLINSPLTIKAQERLVEIAEDDIQDSASESAKYFLKNLKKEIHNKYPQNYVKQASYDQKIMHWGKMPITYAFKNVKGVPGEVVLAVNDAFDTWERASSARIRFEKVSNLNADIIVNFTNRKRENVVSGRKYVIAYTVPKYTGNRLDQMILEFGVINLEGQFFTPNQIYNTALHEIFHALGFMGHSYDEQNIMYMSKEGDIFNDERKVLTDADKTTLILFYKIKPDITNANELKYNYIPYLIFGDNIEVNDTKADEARNYIKKAPNVSAGYIDLAQTLLNQQNYTKAIRFLEKALRLATNDEIRYLAYYNLAVANYYDGNYELAHIYIEKAREIKDDKDLHILEAEIYLKEKNLDKSIEEYKTIIKYSPENIDFAANLASIYIMKHQYIEARKVLKDYIKQNPTEKNNPRLKSFRILLIF